MYMASIVPIDMHMAYHKSMAMVLTGSPSPPPPRPLPRSYRRLTGWIDLLTGWIDLLVAAAQLVPPPCQQPHYLSTDEEKASKRQKSTRLTTLTVRGIIVTHGSGSPRVAISDGLSTVQNPGDCVQCMQPILLTVRALAPRLRHAVHLRGHKPSH